MRIAVMILALVFSVFSGLQSCAIHFGGRIGESTTSAQAGAVGILISMLFLLGGALAIGLPRAAQICFIIAGVLAILNRFNFPDMTYWAVISFILSVMSYYGHRDLNKKKLLIGAEANRKAADTV